MESGKLCNRRIALLGWGDASEKEGGEALESDGERLHLLPRERESRSFWKAAGFEQGSQFVAYASQNRDGTPGNGMFPGKMREIALDHTIDSV
ncbi:MAG TPA: hypothetical protein VKR06_30435 [Ktedonosporobacter sp.]|nr:hypothetical protein [Ktedonosporobacter sp.]